MTRYDINDRVNSLCATYNTCNPYDLADKLGFLIREDRLGNDRGYYLKVFGSVHIVINEALEDYEKMFTAAHELGHAILHDGLNICKLRAGTYYSGSRYEKEADMFAIRLLMQNIENAYDLGYIAKIIGVKEEFIIKTFE